MTPEGLRIVCDALVTIAEIEEFKIYTEIQKGEKPDKIEITSNINQTIVIKALGAAGLMFDSELPHASPDAPRLRQNLVTIPLGLKDNWTLGFIDEALSYLL